MKTTAILVARLIFAGVFLMSAIFKFWLMGIPATAAEIAGAGFPIPTILAWVAAVFEVALGIGFLTGFYFTETAIVAAVYVLFLGFVFHGPSHWQENKMEFGLFVNHLSFIAGLLFAAAYGPERVLAMQKRRVAR